MANGGTEVVDPAPGGATFNTALSAEWGRVTNAWTVNAFGMPRQVRGHFHWVASTDPTPSEDLPTGGILIYDQDAGGTLATHTYGANGVNTEVATSRTNVRIEVDYGNAGEINDFRVSGSFPSGTTYVLQSQNPSFTHITDGFISFANPMTHITVPFDMCSMGCTTGGSAFFAGAVFGPAGPNGAGVTGSFHGNTNQFSYPEHSITGTFIVTP
jgi:hypothetical protein